MFSLLEAVTGTGNGHSGRPIAGSDAHPPDTVSLRRQGRIGCFGLVSKNVRAVSQIVALTWAALATAALPNLVNRGRRQEL